MKKMNEQEKYEFMFRFVDKLDIDDFLDLMDVIYTENSDHVNDDLYKAVKGEETKSEANKGKLKLTPFNKFKF